MVEGLPPETQSPIQAQATLLSSLHSKVRFICLYLSGAEKTGQDTTAHPLPESGALRLSFILNSRDHVYLVWNDVLVPLESFLPFW